VSSLVVNQVYGGVFQGEGPSAGRSASIIRLMGCHLNCAWQTPQGVSPCDESQTWDATRFDLREQGNRMTVDEIMRRAVTPRVPSLVIITGGEPLLHQHLDGWGELFDRLAECPVRVEVETNGTIAPVGGWGWPVDQWNVSPKLRSSGISRARAATPALGWFARDPRAVFKFVCAGEADVGEAFDWAAAANLDPRRVWVMPAGTTADQVLANARAVAPAALTHGFNLTLRTHVLLYDVKGEPR
jgi:7-carboxy-7-deazaguanine synthase